MIHLDTLAYPVFRRIRAESRTQTHRRAFSNWPCCTSAVIAWTKLIAALGRVLKLNANYFEAWLMQGRLLFAPGRNREGCRDFPATGAEFPGSHHHPGAKPGLLCFSCDKQA